HRHGVLHRDIKPANILLADGQAVVADFGIAGALHESGGEKLTATGLAIGTASYMSPEQASGEPVDARSDVYSLGCVLYEMLAGEPPFAGPTAQAILVRRLTEPPPGLRTARETVAAGLEQVVQRALSRVPADRFRSAGDFAAALRPLVSARPPAGPPARRARRSMAYVAAALLVLTLAITGLLLITRSQRGDVLDADLVAIAPFDVLGTDLELWREGLVDVLARNLDGAGPIRTVPPTVVIRRWNGRADRATAADLARRSNAGLALFGSLTALGSDSVRLRATLLDVASERIVGEADLRDAAPNVDRLTDSLSIALLRDLGRVRPVGPSRRTALGSQSLPAIKAFLQGEYYYRRAALDSAQFHYDRAIAADTAFALAMHRLGYSRAWLEGDTDPTSIALRVRAAGHNRGLSPRDSLILLADSLHIGALLAESDTGTWRFTRRTLATLEAAIRRYADDPQLWCELGETHYHLWPFSRAVPQRTYAAFSRCIALDSLYLPVYEHAIELAVIAGDTAAARRYARMFLAMQPSGEFATFVRRIDALIDPGEAARSATHALLSEDVSTGGLHRLLGSLQYVADSAEVGVAVARRYAAGEVSNRAHAEWHLAAALALRGRLGEAYAVRGSDLGGPRLPWVPADSTFFAELAFLGAVPDMDAGSEFAAWLDRGAPAARLALPWWAVHEDTLSITRFASRLEQRLESMAEAGLRRAFDARDLEVARAYLAVAREDTADALRRLEAAPDSLCMAECDLWRLTRARLAAARGRHEEALRLLETPLRLVASPLIPLFAIERARVYERLDDQANAATAYQLVSDLWRNADAQLQPFVDEARRALARLAAERS
ncbi:MAG: serine/threonine protein kinase, partial [Gemmatimonadetes bacterium]|nr:serine/threonine protein kinase [Gemmatimonadota bacterium]